MSSAPNHKPAIAVAAKAAAAKPAPFVPVMKEPPAHAFAIPAEPTPGEQRAKAAETIRARATLISASTIATAAAVAAPAPVAASSGGGDTAMDSKSQSAPTQKRPSRHGKRAAPDSNTAASSGSSHGGKSGGSVADHELMMWQSIGDLLFGVSPDEMDRLKSRVVAAAGAYSRAKLPGPLPVSLGRSHLQRLRTHKYWVAEKSDGVRAMFFVCSAKGTGVQALAGVYFIDRKFAFRRLKGEYEEQFMLAYGAAGDTLLDGELVQALHPPPSLAFSASSGGVAAPAMITSGVRYNYLIYDCCTINGTVHRDRKLPERLNAISTDIVLPFRRIASMFDGTTTTARTAAGADIPALNFTMRGKTFLGGKFLSRLLTFIAPVAVPPNQPAYPAPHLIGAHLYREERKSGVMCNYNDGLIFTAEDEPYIGASENFGLLKWKYVEKNSVDFLVTIASPQEAQTFGHANPGEGRVAVSLRCGFPVSDDSDSGGGGGGRGGASARREGVFRTTHIPEWWWKANIVPHQTPRPNGSPGRVICECAYNRDTGLWELLKVRADKDSPNFLSTVVSTMEGVMDNITTHELVIACNAAAAAASGGAASAAARSSHSSHSSSAAAAAASAAAPSARVHPSAPHATATNSMPASAAETMSDGGGGREDEREEPAADSGPPPDYGFGGDENTTANGGGGGGAAESIASAAAGYAIAAQRATDAGRHVLAYDITHQTAAITSRPYLPRYVPPPHHRS